MQNVLVYTMHKSASMFLHDLAGAVAREFKIDHYSDNYPKQKPEIQNLGWQRFIDSRTGPSCFGPIRGKSVAQSIPGKLDTYSVILHLRDPRDVLVSLYFSYVYSHVRRSGGFNLSDGERQRLEQEGIDRFVLDRASEFRGRYQSLMSTLLGRPNVVFVKYEEMILDFHGWLGRFLSAFAHFQVPSKRVLAIFPMRNSLERIQATLYKRYRGEFTVSSVDIRKNKRQVQPGDHVRKLSADTIQRLNIEFASVLEQLNYEKICKLAS